MALPMAIFSSSAVGSPIANLNSSILSLMIMDKSCNYLKIKDELTIRQREVFMNTRNAFFIWMAVMNSVILKLLGCGVVFSVVVNLLYLFIIYFAPVFLHKFFNKKIDA